MLGGYDRSQYVSERVFATASDGTQDPDLAGAPKRHSHARRTAPCLLYGYGSYGITMPPGFQSPSSLFWIAASSSPSPISGAAASWASRGTTPGR